MPTVRTLIGNIKGPKGDTGATGATGPQGPGATIEVGTVSTTAYGNPVQITNSGTETDAVLDFVIPQGKPGEQTTKMSLLTLDTITTQTTEYPIPAVGDVGSTAWGKIVKFFNDIKTAVTGKVDTTSIVNNLTSTSTDKPLSAAQGKALNDAITATNDTLTPRAIPFVTNHSVATNVFVSGIRRSWKTLNFYAVFNISSSASASATLFTFTDVTFAVGTSALVYGNDGSIVAIAVADAGDNVLKLLQAPTKSTTVRMAVTLILN